MENEVSLYHQLREHPYILFLVGSLLLIALLSLFGILMHRRSQARYEASAKNRNGSVKNKKPAT